MLTIAQFAAKLGKSRQRVHQIMNEGRIFPKPVRVGCYYVIDERAKITPRRKPIDKRKTNGLK